VYQNPIPFGFIYIWVDGGPVSIEWRRYFEVPPFYTSGNGNLNPGQQTWALPPPAFYNEFWVNPNQDTRIRVT
jgi:hypothetical protein